MDNLTYLKILVIDDNPEIHNDFLKILSNTKSQYSDNLNEFEKELFNNKDSVDSESHTPLPGFKIDCAFQGLEGVEYIKRAVRQDEPYALAFVDIRMPPGLDGIETIKQIWGIDPDIQIVICTAYSDYSWEETVNQLGHKENLLILRKPFDTIAVRQLACALTKKWELARVAKNHTKHLQQTIKERTSSLRKSLSLVKATIESSNDGILVVSNDGEIIDYNKKFLDMWKLTDVELTGMNEEKVSEMIVSKLIDPEKYIKTLEKSLELQIDNDVLIEVVKLKNGKIFEFYSQNHRINNRSFGRVFNFKDVTERAALEKKLEYQATHDSLTGLPNRILLMENIKDAIVRADINHEHFALLFIDLDRFKLINDSLNHMVGDEILKLTAQRLIEVIKSDKNLARLGGDEFVLILRGFKDRYAIMPTLDAILRSFDQKFNVSGRELSLTASIGVSFYPTDGKTPDDLLRNADSAMYSAKDSYGNNSQFYTNSMNERNIRKLDIEIMLRQALENNRLFLCYQPQVDLISNEITAVEALVRWDHPVEGIILPMDFIPLAEETGLIVPIGEWVLREACRQNKYWQDLGLPKIRVSVNVTSQQFYQHNFIAIVKKALADTGLEPEYLELELTENTIVSSQEIISTLAEIKNMGVSIAIDDFGTGYSNLSYLKKIPLDRLKIDASFIKGIVEDGDECVIIRSIISIAKNLNLQVLAEGVETLRQKDYLKTNLCNDIQGFYFSHPLKPKDIEACLSKKKETVVEG